jgi:hypothetical protein
MGGAEEFDLTQNNINDLDILSLLEDDEGKFLKETFIVKQIVI